MNTKNEPEEELEKEIQQEPETLSKEQEYLQGWQRSRADLENLQKRLGEDRVRQQVALKRDIAESLIGLADNFMSLVAHAPKDSKDPWVTGVVHVARQFEQVLADFGVEKIGSSDTTFDPVIHEAVSEVKSEKNPGTVVEVVQAGYKVGDTVIRPAKVILSADVSSRPPS